MNIQKLKNLIEFKLNRKILEKYDSVTGQKYDFLFVTEIVHDHYTFVPYIGVKFQFVDDTDYIMFKMYPTDSEETVLEAVYAICVLGVKSFSKQVLVD